MNETHHETLKNSVISLCEKVGLFMVEELGKVGRKDIQTKDVNSLVSYVDTTCEKMIVEALLKLTPTAGFITEEGTIKQAKKAKQWIIDPLDGTNNYLHAIPHFAISIAYQEDGKTILGIVYDPIKKECFHAVRGQGAYLNNKRITVSKTKEINEALLATGFPYTNKYNTKAYVELLIYWLTHSRGIRRFGSAALDLAYVASGRFDTYYEAFLNPWDIAAGILLVQEAGGIVTDFQGKTDQLEGSQTLAANAELHPKILARLVEFNPH